MPVTTTEQLKEYYNFELDELSGDEPILYAQQLAAMELESRISAADFLLLAQSAPIDAALLNRYNRLTKAHDLLSVGELFLTNTQIRREGMISSEVDLNANATKRFLSPTEKIQESARYLARAERLISGFIVVDAALIAETDYKRSIPVEWVF